ncbi:MAG: DUF2892 domain-containing protein [Verrucomicrobia bacterium]|nr:DUF2892 domain-containing protein [Verrucomicrobiota bacterium]
MKPNVGGIDRILRVLVGLGVLGAGFYFKSWWGLIGLGPLGTAALGRCPAYLPFGLNTCRKPDKPAA